MNITWQRLIECIFSPVPVYKISIDQIQRLSYVDQLTLLCIFNIFNKKKITFDLVHFKEKEKKNVMDLLHFGGEKDEFL